MAEVTVSQFAEVLKVPVDRLLLQLDEAGDARRELVERRPQGELEAPVGAELVHEHGGGRARRTRRPLRPLEE